MWEEPTTSDQAPGRYRFDTSLVPFHKPRITDARRAAAAGSPTGSNGGARLMKESILKPYRDMTDDEWERVNPLLPELMPRKEARGRPLTNTRAVLNGVLWVMYSGASWATLPRKYPSYQTCHRRFKAWHESGVLKHITAQLFGASSDAFYEVIMSRMRRTVPREPRLVVGGAGTGLATIRRITPMAAHGAAARHPRLEEPVKALPASPFSNAVVDDQAVAHGPAPAHEPACRPGLGRALASAAPAVLAPLAPRPARFD
jgi:transposase